MSNLISNSKRLKKIQKKTFYNSEIFIEKSAKIFDNIKLKNLTD
jgi:hypothetical protein